jgi:hypothetical protein
MEPQDRLFRYRQFCALLVNELECVPVAAYLFFVAIMQERFAENDGPNTGLLNLNAFDAVRGDRTFDQGMLA